jgi:hypothetical protein
LVKGGIASRQAAADEDARWVAAAGRVAEEWLTARLQVRGLNVEYAWFVNRSTRDHYQRCPRQYPNQAERLQTGYRRARVLSRERHDSHMRDLDILAAERGAARGRRGHHASLVRIY